MSIEINPRLDLSLNDLVEQMNQGTSVLRSAHVGNARAYNLAVASLGIPMLLVDHNLVAQMPGDTGDNNYLPGSIVTRQEIQPLKVSRLGGLAMQTMMIDQEGQTTTVAEFQRCSMQAVFPDTPIFTNTDYLRQFETVAAEAVTISSQIRPDLFRAVVESDGAVRRLPKQGFVSQKGNFANLIETYGVLQLNDDPTNERGVLVPNEVDIVINFIIEAIKSGRQRQIHLSGPDMQTYVKDSEMKLTLSQLYDAIGDQSSFGRDLPDTLEVDLVPVNFAKFATSRQQIPAALAIFEYLRFERLLNSQKGSFMRSEQAKDAKLRTEMLSSFKVKESQSALGLKEVVGSSSQFFADPRDAPFVSQHDVLQEGGLSMPPENMAMTMAELRTLDKRLRRLRGSGP